MFLTTMKNTTTTVKTKKRGIRILTGQPFWVNLLAAIVLAFLIIYLFLQMLSLITKHGEHLTVPSVIGKRTTDAIHMLESQGFEVEIQDSIYTDTVTNGIVLKQLPDPNSTVKVNRTIFLTVNRVTPPMIEMPKLEGLSLRFALDILQRNHLVLEDTIFKPDFMQGSILEQQYNGTRIPEKTMIRWGSRITLIVAAGLDDKQMMVPDLVGLTYSQAKAYLDENKISLGATLVYPGSVIKDTAAAFVYKQNPERFNELKQPNYIRSGQLMDLYIAAEMINLKDSLKNNQLPN